MHSSCSDADDDDDGKSGTSAENNDFYECMKHYYTDTVTKYCAWQVGTNVIPLTIVIESPYGT